MARRRIAKSSPAIRSLVAALLPVACGPGGHGAPPPALTEAEAPRAWTPPADAPSRALAGLRLLAEARGELDTVRRSLSSGAAESAGASLGRTIRDLEEGMALAGLRLSPEAAARFEAARRSADRWQAGEAPQHGAAEPIVRAMEGESQALARALGAR